MAASESVSLNTARCTHCTHPDELLHRLQGTVTLESPTGARGVPHIATRSVGNTIDCVYSVFNYLTIYVLWSGFRNE